MLGDEKVILRMFAAAFAGVVFLFPVNIVLSGLVYDGHGVLAAKISLLTWVIVTLLAFCLLGRTKTFSDVNKLSLQITPTKRSLFFSAKLISLMSAFGAMYGIASECKQPATLNGITISSVEKNIKDGVRVRAVTKRLKNGENETTFQFENDTKSYYEYRAVITFEDPHGKQRNETFNSECFDSYPPFYQSLDSKALGHSNETVVDVEVTKMK